MWRGGLRLSLSVAAPFVWQLDRHSVSTYPPGRRRQLPDAAPAVFAHRRTCLSPSLGLRRDLHRHYPASSVLRASPPPQNARPVPHGLPLGYACTTPWGFPCCVRLPCVHAIATTPAQPLGALFARFPSRSSLPRVSVRVGLRIVLFEDCSAFTHVTACTLAGPPTVIRYIRGFSHFVTSMTAPIATGWSESCRVGLAPTEKRRLCTAHTGSGQCCVNRHRFPVHPFRTAALDANPPANSKKADIGLSHG